MPRIAVLAVLYDGKLSAGRSHGPELGTGAVETFRTLAGEEAHFNGAEFYKAIVKSDGFGPHTDFRYEGSLRFRSSEDLVRRGFMRDLRS